jgi:hypothetical protein
MPFNYAELLVLEMALITYSKTVDLSTKLGQHMSNIMTKIENNLAQIESSAKKDNALSPIN